MTRIVLFEDAAFANFLPLTYWRAVWELRCGRETLASRIERLCGSKPAELWTRAWMARVAAERALLPINQKLSAGDVLVNGRWLPDGAIRFEAPPFIGTCQGSIAYVACDEKLAATLGPEDFLDRKRWSQLLDLAPHRQTTGHMIEYPWDLVSRTADLLVKDWLDDDALAEGDVHEAAVLINERFIRIEPGARVSPLAVLDAEQGPVVVVSGATIGSHAVIRGPAFIGSRTVVHPHAYVHGGTSLGPRCKVGGEIDACVFQGYSNKAHSGFLGHAYVGSWVNIGAGTTNSDLKNTYGTVRVPINGQDVDSDLMFFGCVIGDHVKMGILQAISTGTVIGFAANVAASPILPRFVRSFTWMTDRGIEQGDARRLGQTAEKAMRRREIILTEAEHDLFEKLAEIVDFFEPLAPIDPPTRRGMEPLIPVAQHDRGRP